jgi:hypothetical protein
VFYPIVPQDKERVRLVMHADNTAPQIDEVVDLIMAWSREQFPDRLEKSASLVSDEDKHENTAFSD